MQRRHDRKASKNRDQSTEQEKRSRINHSKRSVGKSVELCSKFWHLTKLVISYRKLLCCRSQLHGHDFYLCVGLYLTLVGVINDDKQVNGS